MSATLETPTSKPVNAVAHGYVMLNANNLIYGTEGSL